MNYELRSVKAEFKPGEDTSKPGAAWDKSIADGNEESITLGTFTSYAEALQVLATYEPESVYDPHHRIIERTDVYIIQSPDDESPFAPDPIRFAGEVMQ